MNALSRFAAAAAATGLLLFAAGSAQAVTVVFDTVEDFNAAATNLQVEDFEGLPWEPANVVKPQPVVDQGLSWYSSNYLIASSMVANSPALSITDGDRIFGGADSADMLWVELPTGVTAVGVFVSTNGQANQGVRIRALDANDVPLFDAITPATAQGAFSFIGLASLTSISKVEFSSVAGPPQDDFFLDDFHFGTWNVGQLATGTQTDVAEPAMLMVFGGALAMFGLAARRRCR